MTAIDAAGAPGLRVHTASRVEDLLDPLLEHLRHGAPGDPFTPITIVVQSRGMQRWLSHQLAQRLDPDGRGIATNLEFPFPGAMIDRIVAACREVDPGRDPWSPDRLVWSVVAELRAGMEHPELARLVRHLAAADAPVDRGTWALARSIADVFDRYALYRPELASRWAHGEAVGPDGAALDDRSRWQPHLWEALVARTGVEPTERLQRTIDRLHDPAAEIDDLPPALLTFGISGLPPRHLDVLAALATRQPVELFVPTASATRWEAIAAPRRTGQPRPDAHHPLLVSCGRLLDDAAELLLEHGSIAPTSTEPSPSPTLLEALQAGIRGDRPTDRDEPFPLEVVSGRAVDRSVQIHACHGPAGQAEVVRDVILGELADDPTLEPRDVLVMTPDIDTYAPLVQAAFGGTEQVPEVPVTVADRHIGRTNPVADALLAILDLAAGRVRATEVLDVIGRDVVRQRFGLSTDDLDVISGWVATSGIRWGIDEQHRERAGQPADRVHTWRFGLDRLLLGATMADEDDRTVGDVTPHDDLEGGAVEVAGRFAEACASVFDVAERCQTPRPFAGWVDLLVQTLDRCTAAPTEARWQLQEVRQALEGLRDDPPDDPIGDGGPADELVLDLGAIRTIVEGSLQAPRGAAGYETGAVTLCALVPMRSIPHRVVCLIGMDDRAFPRPEARAGFDLLDRDLRVGDRDRRAEDRSLFLEAVLAARQVLVVTTTGHDVRTGEDRPPAVPLAELLDVLDRTATTGDPSGSVRQAITREHPLQTFSPRNFGDRGDGTVERPTSFDPVARDAALGRRRLRRRTPFLASPLPETDISAEGAVVTDDGVIALEDLSAALLHPTRFLMERRLGVHLREYATEVDDQEPIDLGNLDRAAIGRSLLESRPSDHDAWLRARLSSGTVPAGTPGHVRLAEVHDDVRRLWDQVAGLLEVLPEGTSTDPRRVPVDLELGERRLVGTVDGVLSGASSTTTGVRLVAAYVRPRPEHLLRAWIAQLALTAGGVTDLRTWIVTRGRGGDDPPEQIHLGPLDGDPDAARQTAIDLLTDYVQIHDLARVRTLPLFPTASPAYAEKGRMLAAHRAFDPNPWMPGSGDRDAYVEHVHGAGVSLGDVLTSEALRDEFASLALRVWGAAMEHRAASEAAGGPA